jgi:hypothetical protein
LREQHEPRREPDACTAAPPCVATTRRSGPSLARRKRIDSWVDLTIEGPSDRSRSHADDHSQERVSVETPVPSGTEPAGVSPPPRNVTVIAVSRASMVPC